MKLKIKAYMSKEAFFELPSAEQRKKAEKYDVYKKYLKEGKSGAKKAVDKKHDSKPASKQSNNSAKQSEAYKEQAEYIKELKDELEEYEHFKWSMETDPDEDEEFNNEELEEAKRAIKETKEKLKNAKARLKQIGKGEVKESNGRSVSLNKAVDKYAKKVQEVYKDYEDEYDEPKKTAKKALKRVLEPDFDTIDIDRMLDTNYDYSYYNLYRTMLPEKLLKEFKQDKNVKALNDKRKVAKKEADMLFKKYIKTDNDEDYKKYHDAWAKYSAFGEAYEKHFNDYLKQHKSDIVKHISE